MFPTFFGSKMIIGHGIDLQDMTAVEEAYQKRPRFAEKILTEAEWQKFDSLTARRKIEYLAGRWSAKEAYAKALGTGIGPIGFQDMEVMNDEKGAPFFSRTPRDYRTWLSISHSGSFVQASVILEEVDESKHT